MDDVSKEKRGRSQLRVEVNGVAGSRRQFPITAREKRLWAADSTFVLALVTRANSVHPSLEFFRGPAAARRFHFEPL